MVVEARGNQPDNRQFDMEEIKANQNSDFGNYIIIDHGMAITAFSDIYGTGASGCAWATA